MCLLFFSLHPTIIFSLNQPRRNIVDSLPRFSYTYSSSKKKKKSPKFELKIKHIKAIYQLFFLCSVILYFLSSYYSPHLHFVFSAFLHSSIISCLLSISLLCIKITIFKLRNTLIYEMLYQSAFGYYEFIFYIYKLLFTIY